MLLVLSLVFGEIKLLQMSVLGRPALSLQQNALQNVLQIIL